MSSQTVSLGSPNSHKSGKAAKEGHVDSHAVTKRLQSELMSLMASSDKGISAFPDGDSLFSWIGTIEGAPGTVFEGLSFKLSLKFPSGMTHLAGQDVHGLPANLQIAIGLVKKLLQPQPSHFVWKTKSLLHS